MRRIFKSRFFRLTVCVVLFLTAFALIAAFTRSLSPIREGASAAARPGERFFSDARAFFTDLYSAYARHTALQAEFDALSMENARLSAALRARESLEEENRTLRALLSLDARDESIEYLPARVIASASGLSGMRLTLDCGASDGVENGMCAVTAQGLAGFIADCAEHSCTLLPLVCTDEGLSAYCPRADVFGVAQGHYALRAQGLVRLSYLDKDADVQVGDLVESAGTGGAYPRGLLIGIVTETALEEHALSRYALVRPFVSFENVRTVYVVTGFTPQ